MLTLAPRRVPAPSPVDRARTFPAEGPRRARVALLSGCAQQVLAPDINAATIEVLARNGVEVVVDDVLLVVVELLVELELLVDAVRIQLRADVPVGASLSGGLDSSGIVALIRGFTDTPVRTFSVAFEDKEFDESVQQQVMVRHLGTEHTSVRCTRRDIGMLFPKLVAHAEQPVLRDVSFRIRRGETFCVIGENGSGKSTMALQIHHNLASRELYGKVTGSVDTREKFEAKRLELAEREWKRMKANNSLECRNCHNFEYMDFTKQNARAAQQHSTYLASGEKTCIDCHKGIAHRLPDMQGVPGWDATSLPPAGDESDRIRRVGDVLRQMGEGQTLAAQ